MTAGADLAAILFSSFFILVLGLCLGSFATALVYRIPLGIPWAKPSSGDKANRSRCPSCQSVLTVLDLVPVFSFLLSRGHCRHCGKKISPIYPLIEFVTMLLTFGIFWAWGAQPVLAPLLLAVPFLVAATLIDWTHMILPDDINVSLTILGILYVLLSAWQAGWSLDVVISALSASVLLFVTLFAASYLLSKIKKREALGRGDLKFLPAAGLFLGIPALPTYLALGGVLGVFTALLKGKNGSGGAFPFGPALIISLYIHVFLTGLGFDYTW